MTLMLQETHINKTEGYSFSSHKYELAGTVFEDCATTAELYRAAMDLREYGRCIGRVYIYRRERTNDEGGERWNVVHVGYVFEKRDHYEDTGEPYLRETWLTLVDVEPRRVTATSLDESE